MNLDKKTMWIIAIVVAVAAYYFYTKSQATSDDSDTAE